VPRIRPTTESITRAGAAPHPRQVGREELIQFLRRVSRAAGAGGAGNGGGNSSSFRGVSRHAKGRWEARIGLSPVDGKRRYK
jgi:hypothetical protein